MKSLIRKISRYAITLILVIIAIVIIYRVWSYYTESPWTRDAKFSADVVAISPDVTGLITDVRVQDNQFVHQGDILFLIDRPRFKAALQQAQAQVDYYQALVEEKRREAMRRNQIGGAALSREAIDQANNQLQTSEHQLAQATAARDLAQLDLRRTEIKAPADGWVTNLNVYGGEFINRGSVAVALVKAGTFYVTAYLEETKLMGLKPGLRAEITPLGSEIRLQGTVESIAAGITNSSSSNDTKGLATIDSNLEWVRLAQRIPVRIRLDKQPGNQFPAGTTATVIISGGKARPTTAGSPLNQVTHRLREFG